MTMPTLTGEELYAWVERTSSGWRELLTAHPEALTLPCNIRASTTVAGLLQHIAAVELLFTEWLSGIPATPAAEPSSATPETTYATIYATHDKAMSLFLNLNQHDEAWWQEQVDFPMRSGAILHGPRRVFAIHMLMHSIRHYAQLATIVRQHGITPNWQMDYLGMIMPPAKG